MCPRNSPPRNSPPRNSPLGTFSGSGGFTGGGDVFFEGGLQPSDPVEVTFGGNAYMAKSTDTVMQLAGPVAGSGYDQIPAPGSWSWPVRWTWN